jgi:hypothetical protein
MSRWLQTLVTPAKCSLAGKDHDLRKTANEPFHVSGVAVFGWGASHMWVQRWGWTVNVISAPACMGWYRGLVFLYTMRKRVVWWY